MPFLQSKVFRHYAFGLGCTFVGAWGMEVSGSMLPLALGAAVSIMTTLPLVRTLWDKKS